MDVLSTQETSAPERIFEGLNEEQRRAVQTVRGPLCILAGAGSGKTTTITRRIAAQVVTKTFSADEILAVTFTDKAAGEMRARLESLGVPGVRARTFHSAAAAQLHGLAAEAPGAILPTKALALSQIARSLPKPYRFRPAADLATEIEWAKNRRISLESYGDSLGDHEAPIPPDLMADVWRRYEDGKRARGLIDFEDLLELALRMFEDDEYALERFREQYRAFTVDEYQDVNLLQQSLLEVWLGERDDVCVVGDDYQSIYSFTGASAEHLIEMPARFPRAAVVRLEANFRSTPQVLAVANRLARGLGGHHKQLRAAGAEGPEPVLCALDSPEDEARFIVESIRRLHREGVSYSEVAVLYRVNFRSEDYEETLAAAGIPFQVRDGGFLQRQAARRMLRSFRHSRKTDIAAQVRSAALRDGWLETPPDRVGERELTRQRDLGRLVHLAEELDDGRRTLAELVTAVEARFGGTGSGGGVNLLTLHRSKGLEFDAVFIPRVHEGELPFKRSTSDDAIAEERRLFYVGITRAKRHLFITWLAGSKQGPSRFLEPLGARTAPPLRAHREHAAGASADTPAARALRSWRLERAKKDGVPAFVVFNDRTLEAIAEDLPGSLAELVELPGIGPAKIERYGDEILAALEPWRQ
ncbi:ATP-dependent DNA helicase UvrD2 [soil metagenome]